MKFLPFRNVWEGMDPQDSDTMKITYCCDDFAKFTNHILVRLSPEGLSLGTTPIRACPFCTEHISMEVFAPNEDSATQTHIEDNKSNNMEGCEVSEDATIEVSEQ